MIDDPELRMNMKDARENVEKDFENVMKLKDLYPHLFGNFTRELFEWAVTFVSTRLFGWGLPASMLVPLADALNHQNNSQITYRFFHKNLHLQSNKIYLHDTDFETFDYDTSFSKHSINISRLFKDDSSVD